MSRFRLKSVANIRWLAPIVALGLLHVPVGRAAAQPPASRSALDELVDVGLERNLGRRQHDLAVRRAEAAVRQARGLYLPTATLNARYSSVSGSVVDLGSVVNPAFDALNQ